MAKYIYFVSFSHKYGTGNVEIIQNFEMSEHNHIIGIQDILVEKGEKDPIVTNFVLLRVEGS